MRVLNLQLMWGRNTMEYLTFSAEILHKQRAAELQETARIERLLHEMKKRDGGQWRQRRFHRKRKSQD